MHSPVSIRANMGHPGALAPTRSRGVRTSPVTTRAMSDQAQVQRTAPALPNTSMPSTPSKTKPSVLNLPTVLDMTAVMWQTRRVPKGGKEYENRDIHGSATVYMDDYFVLEPYSGVLKVTAKIKSEPWYSFFTVDKEAAVRVTFGDRQAIAGYHMNTADVYAQPDAFMWMRKGQTESPSIKLEVVRAFSRERLLFKTDSLADATLDISGENYELEVEVSFVPLQDPSPAASEDVKSNRTEESTKLISSISDVTAEHTLGTAEELAEYVDITSLATNDPTRVSENVLFQGARILGDSFGDGFWSDAEPLAFIENAATLTQALVYRSKATKEIAVSFAGTDMFELPANVREVVDQGLRNDVVTDINLRPVIFDEADKTRDGKESGPLFGFMWGTSTDDLETVHKGFLQAWRSVQDAVESLIEDATGGDPEWKVYFSGHSLGGALATLACASAALKGRPSDKLALYTIGAPRVGNAEFLDAWQEKVPERWRIFNEHDSIPTMPRSTGFQHPTQGFCLMEQEGTDWFEEGVAHAAKASFPDSVPRIMIGEDLEITKEAKQTMQVPYPVVNTLLGRIRFELGLIKQIITRRGFKQHSSPEYMQHLISVTRIAALTPPPEVRIFPACQGLGKERCEALQQILDQAEAKITEFNKNEAEQAAQAN